MKCVFGWMRNQVEHTFTPEWSVPWSLLIMCADQISSYSTDMLSALSRICVNHGPVWVNFCYMMFLNDFWFKGVSLLVTPLSSVHFFSVNIQLFPWTLIASNPPFLTDNHNLRFRGADPNLKSIHGAPPTYISVSDDLGLRRKWNFNQNDLIIFPFGMRFW